MINNTMAESIRRISSLESMTPYPPYESASRFGKHSPKAPRPGAIFLKSFNQV